MFLHALKLRSVSWLWNNASARTFQECKIFCQRWHFEACNYYLSDLICWIVVAVFTIWELTDGVTSCSGVSSKNVAIKSLPLSFLPWSWGRLSCGCPRNMSSWSWLSPFSCAFSGISHTLQITGGAGFVGSHLTDKLMMDGHEVTVVDNFFTGRKRNVEHWIGHENFELINHDVVEPLYIEGECHHALLSSEPGGCAVQLHPIQFVLHFMLDWSSRAQDTSLVSVI